MPTTLIVSCQSHMMVHFPNLNISMLVTLCTYMLIETRRDLGVGTVSTDGSWLNISKFIGTQLRATSYRVKRSECYKVVANTPDSAITYEYEDEIDAPIPDAIPEPLPSIPAQLSYPALPDEVQPVQPAPQHQPLIASDEKTQDSADEQDFPTEQLPRRSTRVRKPPDYLRF